MTVVGVVEKKNPESKVWPQLLAGLSVSVLAVGMGLLNGWPSPSVPKMLSQDLGFEVTEVQASFVVAIEPLGYLVGSPIAGVLLDNIGRKNSLLLLAIPQILSHLLVATANGVEMLYVARFISGVACGPLLSALSMYMCEILEPKVRGILGAVNTLGLSAGATSMIAYGSYVPMRTAAYISLSVPLLFLATFIFMPDSPYYLIIKNRPECARKSLKYLRKLDDVEEELCSITLDVERQMSEPGKLRDIFMIRSNLKASSVVFALRTFQQLSGIAVIAFYNQVIFEEVGGKLSAADSAIVISSIRFLSMCFCLHLVEKFGRKPLFITTSTGSAISLLALGLYFSFQQYGYDMTAMTWLPILSMALYVITSNGLLMIPNLMSGELLSVSIKSNALGIINMYLGLLISLISLLFKWLDRDYGMHLPFYVFAICCLAGAIFCYFLVPETKGKTLEEIQQIFKGSDSRPASNTLSCQTKF